MTNIVIGEIVVRNGNELTINGNKVDVPKHVGIFGNNTTIINEKVFINGWELKKDGTWKRTFKALWHLWFN